MKILKMYAVTLLLISCIFLNGIPTVAAESETQANLSVEESSTASTDQSSSDNETINSSESVTPNFETISSSEVMQPQDSSNSNNDANVIEEINQDLEDALAAGFTKEQYEAIINMPDLDPAEDCSSLNRALLTDLQAKVVSKAKEQLGKPYFFGAQGPNSFDCGGLVRYVFKQAVGMDIPMGTTVQQHLGTAVSLSSLQPGDLLFFVDKYGTTYHVAIYIGNGQYIHSPEPGKNVMIQNMSAFTPQFARRVLVGDSAPAQGNPINDGRYATVVTKNNNIYTSFDWNIKDKTSTILNQTFLAKIRYQHSNGSTYYSLYNNKGSWIGYVHSDAVTFSSNPQGEPINDGRYATVVTKNNNIYTSFGWNIKDKTSMILNQTFLAKVKYHHFNGSTYYSLYNNKGSWIGYVHSDAVTFSSNPQGEPINDGRYATVVTKNNNIYTSFDWNIKDKTSTILNQTFLSKVRYHHFNGSTYYSLYNDNGSWIGYVHSDAVNLSSKP